MSALRQLVELDVDCIDIGDNVRIRPGLVDEMAASIAEHGVLQPILVEPAIGGRHLLVFGQRRLLASRLLGRARIPAQVLEEPLARQGRAITQLVENAQRKDLDPIERARALRELTHDGLTQAQLAREIGWKPSTLSNELALLDLPDTVQQLVSDGLITRAHAKALRGLPAANAIELAQAAAANRWSAHLLEDTTRRRRQSRPRRDITADDVAEELIPIPVRVVVQASQQVLAHLDAIRTDPSSSRRRALLESMETLRTALGRVAEYGWAS